MIKVKIACGDNAEKLVFVLFSKIHSVFALLKNFRTFLNILFIDSFLKY
jgi:hypothetical protein